MAPLFHRAAISRGQPLPRPQFTSGSVQ